MHPSGSILPNRLEHAAPFINTLLSLAHLTSPQKLAISTFNLSTRLLKVNLSLYNIII